MTITNRVSLKSVMAGVTPIADVPDAPTIGAATNVGTSRAYNNGSATVAYTAAATGGTATTFTATSTPGSFTGTGTSPITVTGLQSATSYTFTVTPTNSTATGPASSSSSSITATTVPQAPTIGTVTVTNKTTVSVPFTAGATGGATISSYTITSSPSISLSYSGTTSPFTVTGSFVTNQAYTFTMTATNANGTSAASSTSNSVTPSVGLGGNHFVNILSQSGKAFLNWSRKAVVDSGGNFLVAPSQGSQIAVAKTTKSAITWQKQLVTPSNASLSYPCVDSSNNLYNVNYGTISSAIQGVLAKYNSSGTLQFQTFYNGVYWTSSHIGSDGSVYMLGYNSANGVIALKVNSSGTTQWTKSISASFSTIGAIDSSDNFYAVGAENGKTAVVKFNSAGTLQWQFRYTTGQYGRINAVSVDSSGNVYGTGYETAEGGGDVPYIFKLNSSGVVQWRKDVNNQSENITADSSGNFYLSGSTLAKFDSSGTLQWARSTGNLAIQGVTITGTDLLISGYFYSPDYVPAYGLLPNDGSKTGTYSLGSYSFAYSSASYYVGSTYTGTTASAFSVGNTTITTSSGTLTDSTPSYSIISTD